MEKLRDYLKTLSPSEQTEFAVRCGTTIGYIRKVLCIKGRIGETLALSIERESGGLVSIESLLPEFSLELKKSGYSIKNHLQTNDTPAC